MTFAENFFSREFLEQEILREAYGLIVGYLRQKRATVGVISKRIWLFSRNTIDIFLFRSLNRLEFLVLVKLPLK